jgi:hypothetical protein
VVFLAILDVQVGDAIVVLLMKPPRRSWRREVADVRLMPLYGRSPSTWLAFGVAVGWVVMASAVI